jgi:hypothetical protein
MAKKEDHMQPRKLKFWISVLAGVIILSGGLPFSARHSTAQPLPPGAIKELPSVERAIEAGDEEIAYVLNQRNQLLGEKAQAEGRELTEEEKVKFVRRVILKPHPDSPVQDVIVQAFELSDGTEGTSLTTPTFQPWVKGPFGYLIEAVNLDEGWYIVRFATPEEIQDTTKDPKVVEPNPVAEDEPLSFLEQLGGLFSPAEAEACPPPTCQPPPTPYSHSMYQPLYDQAGPLVARDGIKMRWTRDTSCLAQIVGLDPPRCEPFGAWQYLAPCDAITTGRVFPGYSVYAHHSDQYVSPGQSTNAFLTCHMTGNPDGSWSTQTSTCSISGPLKSSLRCGPTILDPF